MLGRSIFLGHLFMSGFVVSIGFVFFDKAHAFGWEGGLAGWTTNGLAGVTFALGTGSRGWSRCRDGALSV